MLRRLVATAVALLAIAAPASAQEMSANVERIATVPELKTAISIAFIGDDMFVSTAHGVYAYDVADPAKPQLLGALPMYIWENEDMDVDVARKRLFISRDPRGFTSPAIPGDTFPYGAVHIIDVSDPSLMKQIGFFTLGAGHTTTCVNACDVIWTAGPYANAATQPDFVGRPVYATDVTDPADPKPCPHPIDTERNDGVTDYAHDVQVDARGVAWVSGAGGVRGYWTAGEHRNPLTGQMQTATGCEPVPHAGSGVPDSATPSRFMHNAWRDPGAQAPPVTCKRRRHERRKHFKRRCAKLRKAQPAHTLAERTLYGTEENIVSDCATSGRFATFDLEGSFAGEGFRDTATTKHRLKAFDTWTPEKQEGSTACDSAHYFSSRGDGIFANSFYTQGVRFLDVSDPADIRQVGWYRPSDANVWAPYWHKGLVFVADFTRGVDVLKFTGGHRSRTVRAPVVRAARRDDGPRFDRHYLGGLCPLPVATGASSRSA
jgi:hypothetical protein